MSETYSATLVCDEPLYAFARRVLTDLGLDFLPFECGFEIEDITDPQLETAIEQLTEIAGPLGHGWSFTFD